MSSIDVSPMPDTGTLRVPDVTASKATTANRLQIAEFDIEVLRKPIRQMHLSVYPPDGAVRLSVPPNVADDTVRAFAIAKLGWLRRESAKQARQPRDPEPTFRDRESHWVWGRRYLLETIDSPDSPQITLHPRRMTLAMRADADSGRRPAVLARWYRDQIRAELPELLNRWEPKLKVKADRIDVRQMRTKWGSCTPRTAAIRLNTELARKDPACLEYVLVHELVHLREPGHGEAFVRLLSEVLPSWRERRDRLNQSPARHENWSF